LRAPAAARAARGGGCARAAQQLDRAQAAAQAEARRGRALSAGR
jgi:hypothetical protein